MKSSLHPKQNTRGLQGGTGGIVCGGEGVWSRHKKIQTCKHHSAPTASKAWQVWECRESAKVLNFKKWRKLRLALFQEWKAHEDDAPKQNSLQTQFK